METRTPYGLALAFTIVSLTLLLAGCGDDPVVPGVGAELVLEVEGLDPLDPATEGTYEAWVASGSGGGSSAGRFQAPADGAGSISLENPVDGPEAVAITVEPPGDDDEIPSDELLVGGTFEGTEAELSIGGFVTPGGTLELGEDPGTHVLFTPSDNHEHGFPSNEDGGIWVFNIESRKPGRDPDLCDPATGEATEEWEREDFFLDFTPLREGWVYEGWVVRDRGTPDEIWLSYGKLRVSTFGKASAQDDTGFGPFSGWENYVDDRLPRLHCFPGDDWVSNPFDLELPGDLELPLDLNGSVDENGNVTPSRWSHVITIEPARDVAAETPAEGPGAILDARPFPIRPYSNPIGEAPPEKPRTIEFHPEEVPRGTATLRPR